MKKIIANFVSEYYNILVYSSIFVTSIGIRIAFEYKWEIINVIYAVLCFLYTIKIFIIDGIFLLLGMFIIERYSTPYEKNTFKTHIFGSDWLRLREESKKKKDLHKKSFLERVLNIIHREPKNNVLTNRFPNIRSDTSELLYGLTRHCQHH